ncbi:MAG TPA: hypothetical protein VF796_29940 [Humisphaera sp.]
MFRSIRALDRVLKGEATRPASLRGGTIDLPVGGLLLVVVALAAVYGACMGSFALMARWDSTSRADGYMQILASAGKVPLLFALTLVVTMPSLYVFNALVGSRLGFAAVGRLMVAALAVTMAVLASFGTIVVFFSLCTTSYPFIVLLNVLTFAVAGLLGMRFLLQTLQRLSAAQVIAEANAATPAVEPAAPHATAVTLAPGETVPAAAPEHGAATPPPLPGALDRLHDQVFTPQVKTVFRVWIVVFGLVGAQMGWVLRPFIGSPTTPFTFFREREGSFFEAVGTKLGEAVGWSSTGRPRHREDRRKSGTGYGGNGAAPVPVTRPTTEPAKQW